MANLKMFDLSGRVAAVTGGNRGIGRAIALGLAEAGASVAVIGAQRGKQPRRPRRSQKARGAAHRRQLDVRKRADLGPAIEEVERALGPVDILVNNAGMAIVKRALEADAKSWDTVIETNLTSVFLLSQIAARSMVKRGRGKIINLASEYAIFGSGSIPSYSASKGAIVQLTKSMAIELAPKQHPGQCDPARMDRDGLDRAGPKHSAQYDEIIMRTPAGRFGKAEEIAGAAVFLASDASNFVTGTVVNVDGGYSIR